MLNITESMYNRRYYDGSESKCGVTIDGINYLLKRQKRDWNNVFCEYVASNVINALGGCAHKTLLANERDAVVVLCKDFTDQLGLLQTLSTVSESGIDTDMSRHEYYFGDVLYGLRKITETDTEQLTRLFLEMYVFDSLLGNTDRHMGNWGLCKSPAGRIFAPIYDNGACLLPRAKYSDLSNDWLREHTVVFPNSKLMFDKRKRSSYYELWRSDKLPEYCYSYANSLNIDLALSWIFSDNGLSFEQQWFYSVLINTRYRVLFKGGDI